MSYRFADFDLDPIRYQLTRNGEPVDAPRQIFELILLLIRHRDRPVTKEEILATIWHGRSVTEASLTHAIATARRLLGDSPKSQATIRTVHKRGYWWVAETVENRSTNEHSSSRSPIPFVGRDAEVRLVSRSFDQAALGVSSLLLITGEPGIGKTRLLAECLKLARERRFAVLEASCMEQEGAPAGFPWIEIARQCITSLQRMHLVRTVSDPIERLIRAFPTLAGEERVTQPETTSRFAIFEQLWKLISALTDVCPTVIAIDDIHRADELSVSALRFLTRQMRSARISMLASARLNSNRSSTDALARLSRESRATTLPLGALLRADVSVLLEGADVGSPSAVGDFLLERSGGNPFFMVQLIATLRETTHGSNPSALPETSVLPTTVRGAVLRQLEDLEPSARDALSAAAALGRSFSISAVSRVLQREVADVVEDLEAAEGRGILETDNARPATLRFRHEILRDAIYTELSRSERATLHLAIADYLSIDLRGEPAAVSHHLRSAYPLAPATRIAEAGIQSARDAFEKGAFLDAEAECRACLDLAGEEMAPGNRSELLLAMAAAQLRAGRRRDGRLTLRSAALLARAADLGGQLANVALSIAPGFFAIETGTVDLELIETLEEALDVVTEGDSPVRARILGNLGTALYWSPFSSRSANLLEEAEGIAARLRRPDVSAHALAAWFTALWSPENIQARRARCQELLELADASGEADLRLMVRAFRVAIFLEASDTTRLDLELASYEQIANETAHPHGQWYVPMYRAMLAITRGAFEAAKPHMADFVSQGSRFDDANVVQTFLLQSAESAWQTGHAIEIISAVEENVARNPVLKEWQCALAFLLAVVGSRSEARSLCERLILEWGEPHASRMNAPIGFAALAEACWLLDDGDLAQRLSGISPEWEARTIVAGYGVLCWGSTARGMAHIAAATGRLDDAATLYREAIDIDERAGAEPWATRTRLAYARTLKRRGRAADDALAGRLMERVGADALRLRIWLPVERDRETRS
jgi:DNA-binding winged helix-turn-helix (wHTH) protein/tetratricopeptide (TPR) repeat protein